MRRLWLRDQLRSDRAPRLGLGPVVRAASTASGRTAATRFNGLVRQPSAFSVERGLGRKPHVSQTAPIRFPAVFQSSGGSHRRSGGGGGGSREMSTVAKERVKVRGILCSLWLRLLWQSARPHTRRVPASPPQQPDR